MEKEEIEEMRISPVTTIQLERIFNYLVNNKGYAAQFGNMKIVHQGDYEIENNNKEMFIIYRNKEE